MPRAAAWSASSRSAGRRARSRGPRGVASTAWRLAGSCGESSVVAQVVVLGHVGAVDAALAVALGAAHPDGQQPAVELEAAVLDLEQQVDLFAVLEQADAALVDQAIAVVVDAVGDLAGVALEDDAALNGVERGVHRQQPGR